MSSVTAPEVTAVTTWNIDPVHSTAQFKVKHMMISNVKGEFTAITGKLELNGADIAKSKVEASVDAATINTREAQRDAHLKSPDFLDVEKFPVLNFKSTRVSKEGVDELAVEGDLSIHGVTRNVVFEVEGPSAPIKDPWGALVSGSPSPRVSVGRILAGVERHARDRWHPGGRRRDHHGRRRVRKGVTNRLCCGSAAVLDCANGYQKENRKENGEVEENDRRNDGAVEATGAAREGCEESRENQSHLEQGGGEEERPEEACPQEGR